MPDIIQLLPDSIANQIAAGEVIQRPASAVKELLENAVDAGGTEIKLILKDAGKTLLQVIDNGCGMSDTDARMCFERHATSKIKNAADLFTIRTMGFRGEALASIASIAQVELKTRTPLNDAGTKIIIEGFELKSQELCQCAQGTTISVKNLFYNVPARRNFLKSNTVELKHIIDEFQHIALAHPAIFFSMQHNGVELFHLKPANLRQRIIHLFGNNYNEKLVPVEEKTSVTNIHGFIGKPESAKKTKGEQFFFVNNRYIRSPYLHHAVMSVYDDFIPENSYPLYTIFIDIEPSRIDVNVHPTKQEIKFEDDRIIYTFIQAALRHALAQYSVTPTLDFDQDPTFANLPAYYKKQTNTEFRDKFQNVSFKTIESRINELPSLTKNEKVIQSDINSNSDRYTSSPIIESPIEAKVPSQNAWFEHDEKESPVFQLHNQYIITPIKSGFIVIDQQAAHERVLYEKYLARLHGKTHLTQQQLFPQTLNLSSSDAAILNEIASDINNLGFDVQPFGKDTFVIHGIPAEFENMHQQKVIEDIIEQFKEDKAQLRINKQDLIAKSLAKSNAIKPGQKLTEKEMYHLIDELFACAIPYASPAGTHTFVTFGLHDLEKHFNKSH